MRRLSMILIIVLLMGVFSGTGLTDENHCSLLKTHDGSYVNPKDVSIIKLHTLDKSRTGSNMKRYKLYLITVSGNVVLYNAWNGEYSQKQAAENIKNKVQECLMWIRSHDSN